MPLTLATIGETVHISRIIGREPIVKHLLGLGFAPHASVSVLSRRGGSLIVQLQDARIAIDAELAGRIQVCAEPR